MRRERRHGTYNSFTSSPFSRLANRFGDFSITLRAGISTSGDFTTRAAIRFAFRKRAATEVRSWPGLKGTNLPTFHAFASARAKSRTRSSGSGQLTRDGRGTPRKVVE